MCIRDRRKVLKCNIIVPYDKSLFAGRIYGQCGCGAAMTCSTSICRVRGVLPASTGNKIASRYCAVVAVGVRVPLRVNDFVYFGLAEHVPTMSQILSTL